MTDLNLQEVEYDTIVLTAPDAELEDQPEFDFTFTEDVKPNTFVKINQASGAGLWYDKQVGSSFKLVSENSTQYLVLVQDSKKDWVYKTHSTKRSF